MYSTYVFAWFPDGLPGVEEESLERAIGSFGEEQHGLLQVTGMGSQQGEEVAMIDSSCHCTPFQKALYYLLRSVVVCVEVGRRKRRRRGEKGVEGEEEKKVERKKGRKEGRRKEGRKVGGGGGGGGEGGGGKEEDREGKRGRGREREGGRERK